MSRITLLTKVIDEELVEKNKNFMTLAQANKVLFENGHITEVEKQTGYLKKLLENNEIKNASQTESSPKQWRIFLSNKELKHKQQSKSIKKEPINTKKTTCPNCGVNLTIPKHIIDETYIMCLNCGCDFKNPNVGSTSKNKVFKKKSIKKENINIGKTQRNWIIVILIAVIFIIYALDEKNSTNSSSSQYYVNTTTYVATSKASFQEMFRYINDGDNQALSSLMLNGRVKTLSNGTRLNLVSSHFSHCVVRLRGSTQNLWIVTEHITREK